MSKASRKTKKNRDKYVESLVKAGHKAAGYKKVSTSTLHNQARGAEARLRELGGSERIILPSSNLPENDGWRPKPFSRTIFSAAPTVEERVQMAVDSDRATAEFGKIVAEMSDKPLDYHVMEAVHGEDLPPTFKRNGEPFLMPVVLKEKIGNHDFKLYHDLSQGFVLRSRYFSDDRGIINDKEITAEDLERGWGLSSDYQ